MQKRKHHIRDAGSSSNPATVRCEILGKLSHLASLHCISKNINGPNTLGQVLSRSKMMTRVHKTHFKGESNGFKTAN